MKKIYSPKEFSKLIKKSYSSLRLWDKKGILVAKRTPTNRRYYTEDQCKRFLGDSALNQDSDTRKVAATRLKKERYEEIKTEAAREDKNISSYIEGALEDHLQLRKKRGYKEMLEKLSTVIPDLNEQGQYYLALKKSLDSYTDQNQRLHSYIAEQKSAESYYFKELSKMLENISKESESTKKMNQLLMRLFCSTFMSDIEEGSQEEELIKTINKELGMDLAIKHKEDVPMVKFIKRQQELERLRDQNKE